LLEQQGEGVNEEEKKKLLSKEARIIEKAMSFDEQRKF
jgi:hypothetical protein